MDQIENLKLFTAIFESSFAAQIVFDTNERVIFCNLKAREYLRLENNHDFSNFRISKIFNTSQRKEVISFDKDFLKQPGTFDILIIKTMAETPLYCRGSFSKLSNKLFLLSFIDISSELRLQREIKTKQEDLQLAYEEILKQYDDLKVHDKAKDRFISLMSHELRTPLSAILATADMLTSGLCTEKSEIEDHLNTIYDQGNHLLQIVNDILDFSKITSGKMELYINFNDLKSAVLACVNEMQGLAQKKSLNLKVVTGLKQTNCYFDEIRFKQILINLMSNAIKFSPENGDIIIEMTSTDGFILVSVTDHGIGISKEDIDKIFNEFETLEKIARHSKGTGLGLSISKKLVESMGGAIQVSSVWGQGSTFTFSLPTVKILSDELYRSREEIDFDLLKGAG